MSDGSFEGKLHGFRRTQDGVVISYVVHPNDVSAAMATAALGTRYMVGFSEIGDDGKPIETRSSAGQEQQTSNLQAAGSNPAASTKTKERKPFDTLELSAQAAIRGGEPEFWEFLSTKGCGVILVPSIAACAVRELCDVKSRAELNSDEDAAARWLDLEEQFQRWRNDKMYKDARR